MKIFPRGNLFGEYAVPPDKSITHRAIILGTIAKGKTTIINPLINQETLSILSCVKRMGAKVSVKKNISKSKIRRSLFIHPKSIAAIVQRRCVLCAVWLQESAVVRY